MQNGSLFISYLHTPAHLARAGAFQAAAGGTWWGYGVRCDCGTCGAWVFDGFKVELRSFDYGYSGFQSKVRFRRLDLQISFL